MFASSITSMATNSARSNSVNHLSNLSLLDQLIEVWRGEGGYVSGERNPAYLGDWIESLIDRNKLNHAPAKRLSFTTIQNPIILFAWDDYCSTI